MGSRPVSSLPVAGVSAQRAESVTPPAEDVARCVSEARAALEELKARDLIELDIRAIANFADTVIIASGTSTRHVKALADNVVEKLRDSGIRPIGVEGERDAEWILIDYGSVVVHVMLPTARTFYDLESLWRPAKTAV